MASILSNILAPSASLSLFSLPLSSSPSPPRFPLPLPKTEGRGERYLEQIITTGLAGGCLLYFSCSEHSHFVVSILQIPPSLDDNATFYVVIESGEFSRGSFHDYDILILNYVSKGASFPKSTSVIL